MQFVQYLCTLPSDDTYGYIQALPFAKVNVYLSNEDGTNGAQALLYAADGITPIPNPVIADINGFAGFAADDGLYNIQVTDANGVRNAPLAVKVQLFDQESFTEVAGVVAQAVIGQNTSTDQHFAQYDGTTGAKVKDNGISLDTDVTLSADSDTRLPSQKAVKAAINASFAAHGAVTDKGAIDCSGNPNYPAANLGDLYYVSVSGKIGGASGTSVTTDCVLICKANSTASGDQATVGASWSILTSGAQVAALMAALVLGGDLSGTPSTAALAKIKGLALSTDVPVQGQGWLYDAISNSYKVRTNEGLNFLVNSAFEV